MDQRIEFFLTDVLGSRARGRRTGRGPQGGARRPADCEAIFRARETNKRMRDKAAHACHALCRARVAEELQRDRRARVLWSSRCRLMIWCSCCETIKGHHRIFGSRLSR